MKYLIFLILFLSFYPAFTQNTFNVVIDKNEAQKPMSVIQDSEGNFIIAANNYDLNIYSPIILKISSTGELLKYENISATRNSLIYDIIKNGDSLLIFGATFDESIDNSTFWAKILDENFNVIFTKKIITGYKFIQINSKINSRKNYILYGGVKNPDKSYSSFFAELTPDFNIINILFYGKGILPGLIFDVLEKKDKSGYFLFQYNDSCIIDIDTSFNIQKKYRYLPKFDDNSSMCPNSNNSLWLTDSTYIISGCKLNNNKFDIALIIADTLHQTLFSYVNETAQDDKTAYWDNLIINKDIFFVGTLNRALTDFDTTPNHIIISCLDSTLKFKWNKLIGGDAHYEATNAILTNDKGIFIASKRTDNQNNFDYDLCFFRLDSLGNITYLNSLQINPQNTYVYPNPSNNYLTISWSCDNNSAFKLYNISGELVSQINLTKEKTIINTSIFPDGIYIYKILTDNNKPITGKIIIKHQR